MNSNDTLPPSSTCNWINLTGLAAFLSALSWLCGNGPIPITDKAVVLLLAASLPIVTLDLIILKTHRRDSTGIDWEGPCQIDIARSLTKLLGFGGTVGGVALCYWAFPEYHGSFYAPFWGFLRVYGPYALLFAVPYFFLVDARMLHPLDGYWHLGRLILGRSDFSGNALWDHARGWLIKAFFLPLMFVYLCQNVGGMSHFHGLWRSSAIMPWYDFFCHMAFTVDLAFAAAGYILSLRLIDSHVRSSEPTILGWVVALFCYQPFYSVMNSQYVGYDDGTRWGNMFEGMPVLQIVWGGGIILLLMVYAWATVSFGCRFSNLTHRGILTSGPYRFTKHPAYLAKNMSWWLISVPFISAHGWDVSLRNCLLLLCVNGIYWLRARTEERHLSADPAYVAYALWINEHGLFRWIARSLPALGYRPPQPDLPITPPATS